MTTILQTEEIEMKEIYLEKIFDNIFVAIQSLVNGVEYLGIEVSADLQVRPTHYYVHS